MKLKKRENVNVENRLPAFFTIQFYMAGILIPKHTRDIHYVTFASREPGI